MTKTIAACAAIVIAASLGFGAPAYAKSGKAATGVNSTNAKSGPIHTEVPVNSVRKTRCRILNDAVGTPTLFCV